MNETGKLYKLENASHNICLLLAPLFRAIFRDLWVEYIKTGWNATEYIDHGNEKYRVSGCQGLLQEKYIYIF